MPSLNKIMIIGNVGRDPELRYTQGGKAVVNFSVGVGAPPKERGGDRQTDWFNVVGWDKIAEFANDQLAKGSLVYVEGRLQARSWEGKDGEKHLRTEVVMQNFQSLSRKDAGRGGRDGGEDEATDDDIPF